MSTKDSKTIEDLREALFSTLEAVKTGQMDLERASAVNDIGKTIIASAKVDFLRVTRGIDSRFLNPPVPKLPPGITSVTQHRIR